MKNGTVDEAKARTAESQKQSILEKIQADIYTEEIKKGKSLTKSEIENIIKKYGRINGTTLTTTEGEFEIKLDEIIKWKQAQ